VDGVVVTVNRLTSNVFATSRVAGELVLLLYEFEMIEAKAAPLRDSVAAAMLSIDVPAPEYVPVFVTAAQAVWPGACEIHAWELVFPLAVTEKVAGDPTETSMLAGWAVK
jgi:hypothetical protein